MVKVTLLSLRKKRDAIIASFDRFKDFVDNYNNDNIIEELKIRLNKSENALAELEQIIVEIEEKEGACTIETSEQIVDFEELYFKTLAKANKLIDQSLKNNNQIGQNSTSSPAQTQNETDCQIINNVRLPTLNLPEFDGKYQDWSKFRDTFQALINSNTNLSQIQKFHYLLSSVKGSALEVIHSLEISDTNFAVAWNLLTERYQNEKLTIHSHIKAIFELPTLLKENGTMLRKVLDDFLKNIRALKALKQPVEHWDTLLIYLLTNKLDNNTRRFWETSLDTQKLPTLEQLENFLKKRCQLLETISNNTVNTNNIKVNVAEKTTRNTISHRQIANVGTHKQYRCNFCKESHLIYYCEAFLKLKIEDRLTEIKKLHLCLKCLKPNHMVKDCTAQNCIKCKKPHNALLHFTQKKEEIPENIVETSDHSTNTLVVSTHAFNNKDSYEMLSTAMVNIFDKNNKPIKVRVLLDNGSTTNYMTKELSKILGLPLSENIPFVVSGINNSKSTVASEIKAKISSTQTQFIKNLSFLVIDKITENIPLINFDSNNIKFPTNIELADPKFNISRKIDLLLGADTFYKLLLFGKIQTSQKGVNLQKTRLGWIVTGRIDIAKNKHLCHLTISKHSEQDIQNSLEKFWQLEEIENKTTHTLEEIECEEEFASSTSRDSNGRFIVRLPLKDDIEIGDSYQIALKRFHGLENRFTKNLELKKQYCEFMREYESLGHMEKINENIMDNTCNKENLYYIPHHSVTKSSSSTTALRVVFDASAKTTNGRSLNDILKSGPVVQSDLFSILLRFRKYNIVVSADCEKMFRQVLMDENHRDYQRILWREKQNDPISTFRLKTITYGTTPATFLATRCIKQIAKDHEKQFPVASKAIIDNTYIDDFLAGADDEVKALELKQQVDQILSSAGFRMRKWCSNSTKVLKHCANVNTNDEHIIKNQNDLNTLGVAWDSKRDIIKFKINLEFTSGHPTSKRSILSTVGKVFDPLGLIQPLVISIKILLQELWKLKLNWDDPVPEKLQKQWLHLRQQINTLKNLDIKRHILNPQPIDIQIHGFCDASEQAYGCAIYLRSTSQTGEVMVALVCAKSRVAPIEKITLPKLELCGAVLLAKLAKTVVKHLELEISNITYWTDSTIVLSWLAEQPARWKTFVANRVSKIQDLTNITCWKHVRSKDNPADIVSRGMDVHQLSNSIWWEGPSWLSKNIEVWPNVQYNKNLDTPEKRQLQITLTSTKSFDLISRYSSLNKLQRITAWCIRFSNNSNILKTKIHDPYLTVDELKTALDKLIIITQNDEFSQDITNLKKERKIQNSSKILALSPFIDNKGILRVGGRIKYGEFDYSKKHPVILPKSHALTKLIIKNEHLKNLHAGAQTILASLRENYWPLSGLNTIKGILRQCLICFKVNPLQTNTKMGNLPPNRLKPMRPFTVVSIDFAGPFLIKDSKLRNKKLIKAYICVFVCFATKAIHIELVGDLTSQAFLNSLKRFVARRGIPNEIYSDNATNFKSANRQLTEITNSLITNAKSEIVIKYFQDNQVVWKFMPARSPHFGGLHESAVKSVKIHLKKIIGNISLTFENLSTVLCQIESILNSRPLFACSNDPRDLNPLTPAHFLIGDKFTSLPDRELSSENYNRLTHFEKLQHLIQHFWKRWSRDYLCQLQVRHKWKTIGNTNVEIGDLVLLKEENLPPLYWCLGRIANVHPGADGIIRVVSVKTRSALVKRAINKICPLPKNSSNVE